MLLQVKDFWSSAIAEKSGRILSSSRNTKDYYQLRPRISQVLSDIVSEMTMLVYPHPTSFWKHTFGHFFSFYYHFYFVFLTSSASHITCNIILCSEKERSFAGLLSHVNVQCGMRLSLSWSQAKFINPLAHTGSS